MTIVAVVVVASVPDDDPPAPAGFATMTKSPFHPPTNNHWPNPPRILRY